MRSLSTRATGLIILVLGVWGGLVPFVGPYFHFALGPTKSWTWTSGRFYLDVLPGIVAVLGGLMLMSAGPRRSARLGALLAMAAGFWFAIGPEISLLWNASGAQGVAHGSRDIRMLEMLTYHTGLGVLIAALAGYALPRFPAHKLAAAEAGGVARGAGAGAAVGAGAAGIAARRRHEDGVAADEDAAATPRHEPVAVDEHDAADGRETAGERDTAGERETSGELPVTESTPGREAGEQPTREPADVGAAGTAGTAHDTDTAVGNGATAPGGTATVRRRQGGLLSGLLRR